jgi:hypothetical protein
VGWFQENVRRVEALDDLLAGLLYHVTCGCDGYLPDVGEIIQRMK